jgi:predicted permease
MSELAVRFALGASRPRLIRQLLLEAALLGGASAALGLLLARTCLDYVIARVNDLPWWFSGEFGLATVGFAVTAALAAGALAGIAPALKLTRVSVHDTLKESQPGFARVRFGRWSSALLVAQMAIAIGFVSALGLLAASLFGFSYARYALPAREVLVAQLYFGPPEGLSAQMPTAERRAIWQRHLEQCRAQQRAIASRLALAEGVREVAYASLLPGNDVESAQIEIEGGTAKGAEAQVATRIAEIGAGFFSVLDARPLQGRDFLTSEHEGEPRTIIVNEPFARRHFGGNALGRRLRLLPEGEGEQPGPWLEVVGVVPDLAMNPGDPEHADGIYVPLGATNVVRLAIRTTGDPGMLAPVIHEAVALLAPRAQVQWTVTLEKQMAEVVTIFRSLGGVLLVIGGTALLLTAVSLFSLVSFAVTQRTREIGIRVALGATRRAVLSGVFRREGLQLVLGGALGAALAVAVARLVLLMPFPLRTAEPYSLAACVALLVGVGLAACAAPLRHALAIQPTEALRHD